MYDNDDEGVEFLIEGGVNPRTKASYTKQSDILTAPYRLPVLPLPDDASYGLDDASGLLYEEELLKEGVFPSQLAGTKRKRARKERSSQSVSQLYLLHCRLRCSISCRDGLTGTGPSIVVRCLPTRWSVEMDVEISEKSRHAQTVGKVVAHPAPPITGVNSVMGASWSASSAVWKGIGVCHFIASMLVSPC